MTDKLTPEEKEAIRKMQDRANALLAKGKIPVKDLQALLRENGMSDKMDLPLVDLDKYKLPNYLAEVEAPTPLQLVWCWFIGYAKQEAVAFDNGQKVDSPLSIFSWAESLVANWWKYLAVLIFAVLFLWLAFR